MRLEIASEQTHLNLWNVRLGASRQFAVTQQLGRFREDSVAKLWLRLRLDRDLRISTAICGERSMMGRRERGQGQFFYRFDLDKVVPTDHLVRQIDGVLDLDWVHKELALVLLAYGSAFDRSGADDPDVPCGLRVCDPLGAAAVLRGTGQSGLSVVLRARHRGWDTRPFGVQPCPA